METFWLSFTNCFEPYMLLVTFLGVAGGIVIGAIPGLTPPMAIAIMTSFTFGMDSIAAISLMIGVYFGGVYGGGIGSILLNIPGTPGAIMSVLMDIRWLKGGKLVKLSVLLHGAHLSVVYSG